MHVIPTRIHGMLDYIVALLLILAPWLFGFADNGPAQWVPVTLGVAIIIYSLLTDYELGAVSAIPLGAHLGIDVLAGIFLTMSPWLFGFDGLITWPHVVFGLLSIVVATLTPSRTYRLAARM
jgi:hypothetical protein